MIRKVVGNTKSRHLEPSPVPPLGRRADANGSVSNRVSLRPLFTLSLEGRSHLCKLCVKSVFFALGPRGSWFKRGEEFQDAALGGVRKQLQRQTRNSSAISALVHHKLHTGNSELGNDQL